MKTRTIVLVTGLLVALIGAGGTLWWMYRAQPQPPAPVAEAPAAAPEPAPASTAVADAGERHPIEAPAATASAAAALPSLDESDAVVQASLAELLTRQGVMAFLNADGFVRRAVVTVDNLARPHAASRLWPVQATPGKLQLLLAGDAELIAADNARRYEPFVGFVVSVEPARAAAMYRRLYPLFRQAYAELGYPKGQFNDRLVEVIDQLLAAPEPKQPPALKLVDVKGEVPSTRPWVRYEYTDPALESLSAGQKIMVRVGATHERRLKAWLSGFRKAIASPR